MFKITYTNKEGYEDNNYNTNLEVIVDEESNIHSYFNAFVLCCRAAGFSNMVIHKGIKQSLDDIEATLCQ